MDIILKVLFCSEDLSCTAEQTIAKQNHEDPFAKKMDEKIRFRRKPFHLTSDLQLPLQLRLLASADERGQMQRDTVSPTEGTEAEVSMDGKL